MSKPSNCHSCNKEFGFFNWRHHCENCNFVYCSSCIVEFNKDNGFLSSKTYEWYMLDSPIDSCKNDFLCKSCWDKDISKFDENYHYALQNYDTVEYVSINYKGKIPLAQNTPSVTICSNWYKNKNTCLKELKVTALTNKLNIIYKVEYRKRTESEATGHKDKGTYHYSVWQAECIGSRKKD